MTIKYAITSAECECAVPQQQRYALSDGGGLHLIVQPSGKKSWHVRYRVKGKTKGPGTGRLPGHFPQGSPV
ncbi:uncharacterized protein DUF4102 [Desulfobotulus alkaliphilus]|uniref:Uncharacterized protein DUF4102 n=1 Tax=Desulfobotulus alkaliphilus TaxID=622671 RepID=A0A562QYY3_9BACT|nr:Arm DNA-binding domain-containing protein [Desulfobotulus alkaliphilus]TWI61346.1 uncharacterized protein DUF4102 [Desulfobotulus alkaliphilus]